MRILISGIPDLSHVLLNVFSLLSTMYLCMYHDKILPTAAHYLPPCNLVAWSKIYWYSRSVMASNQEMPKWGVLQKEKQTSRSSYGLNCLEQRFSLFCSIIQEIGEVGGIFTEAHSLHSMYIPHAVCYPHEVFLPDISTRSMHLCVTWESVGFSVRAQEASNNNRVRCWAGFLITHGVFVRETQIDEQEYADEHGERYRARRVRNKGRQDTERNWEVKRIPVVFHSCTTVLRSP